jgi:hypothetical protein
MLTLVDWAIGFSGFHFGFFKFDQTLDVSGKNEQGRIRLYLWTVTAWSWPIIHKANTEY